jgi:hypothetical protein
MIDNAVIKIVLIVILSLLPSLIYWLVSPSVKQRWQSRLRRTRLMTAYQNRGDLLTSYHSSEIEFDRYVVGNADCRFNAHSPYVRCAVNPSGPCEDCIHYEKREQGTGSGE